ncbi:hypothetical protein CKO25_11095 [Thiocapsa imhoffii]|uniref:HNH endonuclease n=1 Tax=Thiocapsa imhoffii TaxID=382777 RepID=A0A9X0WI60_9GAMM|nr:HNH endonuclease [Thiocapsa imhoffii]MBK1645181.1 hypothetical protein [Thiocapsa imhoffii]
MILRTFFTKIGLLIIIALLSSQSAAFTSTLDDSARIVAKLINQINKSGKIYKNNQHLLKEMGKNIDDFVVPLSKYTKEERIKLLLDVAENKKIIKGTEKLKINRALLKNEIKEDDLIKIIRTGGSADDLLIKARIPHNQKYAGKIYHVDAEKHPNISKKYPNGVKFTDEGYPDFSPYAKAKTKVEGLTGSHYDDVIKSNRAMGYKKTPEGYTWHHVEDCLTMILVPTDLHNVVRHSGGAEKLRKGGVGCQALF